MIALILAIVTLLPMTALAEPVIDSRAVQAQSTRTAPLTIGEVLARIELTHPLLRGMGAERAKARAKIERLAKLLTDDLQGRAHDGIVARRPGGVLAGFDCGKIG